MSRTFRNVVIASGLLKFALAVVFADLPPRYDETEFLRFGRAIAETGADPVLWRAPGYQWFVALGLRLAGGHVLGVRLLQGLVSLASTILVYRIGRRWGEPVALAAGTFVAFYPSHVAFSHLLWSESLYGFVLLVGFERLLAADERDSLPAALVAGLAFGAAALTRSVGLALLFASLLWLAAGAAGAAGARPPFRRLTLAGVVAAGALLVVAPYAWTASERAGRLVVVDSNSGFNLWSGNNEYIPADLQGLWCVGLPLENGIDARFARFLPDDGWRRVVPERMARDGVRDREGPDGDAWYRARALAEVRAHPGAALARIPRKLAAFWAPDFFLPRHLLRDWYGPVPPALALILTLLTWAAAAVPLILSPIALAALLPGDRFRGLAVLWVAAYLAAHALAYGHSRMHQPLVPILTLAVARYWLDTFDEPRRARALRALPLGAVALALWITVSPALGGLYVMPGPRHTAVARMLALGRNTALPGAERSAWMLAGVEASAGREDEAREILEQSRGSEAPWTLYLRALVARHPDEANALLNRALAADPDLWAAQVVRSELSPAR